MDIQQELLIKIFDATLEELYDISIELPEGSIESIYCEVLKSYLQGHSEKLCSLTLELEALSKENPKSNVIRDLYFITKTRSAIRSGRLTVEILDELKNTVHAKSICYGEAHFVLGFAYHKEEEWSKSKDAFKIASKNLEAQGAKKKALLAFQNVVTTDSRSYPGKLLFNEYIYLARKAEAIDAHVVAGMAYLNLSREYQKANAYLSAIKYCNLSEEKLSRNLGTLQYYLVRVHKCHLLFQIGSEHEAKIVYDEVKLCPIPEIQNSLKVIKIIMGESTTDSIEDLPFTWSERLSEIRKLEKKVKLGELEEKLIELLVNGPLCKYDLIEKIYGTNLEFSKLENRFKVLLSRLRKKVPNLIVSKDGKYQIADSVLLDKFMSKAA